MPSGPPTTTTVLSLSSNSIPTASGIYFEDYYYDFSTACGGIAGANANAFLDSHNGHDHGDNLGYHYHVTIDSAGIPTFPNGPGPTFYGCLSSGLNCCPSYLATSGGGPPSASSSGLSSQNCCSGTTCGTSTCANTATYTTALCSSYTAKTTAAPPSSGPTSSSSSSSGSTVGASPTNAPTYSATAVASALSTSGATVSTALANAGYAGIVASNPTTTTTATGISCVQNIPALSVATAMTTAFQQAFTTVRADVLGFECLLHLVSHLISSPPPPLPLLPPLPPLVAPQHALRLWLQRPGCRRR